MGELTDVLFASFESTEFEAALNAVGADGTFSGEKDLGEASFCFVKEIKKHSR